MTLLSMHGESAASVADSEGDKHISSGEADAMQVSQADARFLRNILVALILSTVAVGAAAGFAAVNGGMDAQPTVLAADR